jgi:voltage-gated potassium channel Kch
VAVIVLTGRYLLNPFFRLLARAGGREVMTASALLVVLGAAWLMSKVGMSMALGAFLAGLLLAESNFRHELEADIEPFKGLLLGLFFMSVGMLIDVRFVWANILQLIGWTVGVIGLKFAIVYAIARADRADHLTALRAASVLTPAGEFSFVILPLAAGVAVISAEEQRFFTAVAAVTMLAGPALSKAIELLVARIERDKASGLPERTEDFSEARGNALVIGFGRFGQQVNQMLLSAGTEVTVIDNDIEMIQAASRFGFKVYFGDGARLDVLRAAGAEEARIICICIDKPETAVTITELAKANFPLARVHVRAYDRRHALELMAHEPDLVVRETFEAALAFGHSTLEALGLTVDEADAVREDVRRRDMQRLLLQQREGISAGTSLTYKQAVTPQPLSEPKVKSVALSPETQVAIDGRASP